MFKVIKNKNFDQVLPYLLGTYDIYMQHMQKCRFKLKKMIIK